MMKFSGISLSLLFVLSCSQPASVSHTKEQIDTANNLISRYGLSSMPSYDEILQYPSVMIKNADGTQRFPWIDTYWPTGEKNLARRWSYLLDETEANQDQGSDYFLASYFKTEIEALARDELSVYLAPSEKFDILYRSKKGLSLNAENAQMKTLEAIEEKQAHANFEGLDASAILGMNRSWAAEYARGIRSGKGAESLQSLAPLTSEGMLAWLDKSSHSRNKFPGLESEGIDWDWEGICHGWAPAAIYSDEPKHSVKVEVPMASGKKSLIVTEGDIRGLLSKVWADADNRENFFIGRRCEKDLADSDSRGPRSEHGRGVSGTLTYGRGAEEKTSLFTIVQDYPRSQGSSSLMRIILESEWKDGNPRYAYLIAKNSWRRQPSYRLVFDETQAFAEVEKNQAAEGALPTRNVEIFGCWDVNPASFHTLLIENLGKKNLGFVMDRTQSAQVWNQPIGAADFEIAALKALSELGESDNARFYRAPGTAFVAEVTATVHWASEPGSPSFSYSEGGADLDPLYLKSSVYTYTLEFDADKRLIGGEWGLIGELQSRTQNPDFLYGFSELVEPNLNAKPFLKEGYDSFIKKIHSCSLKAEADGETELESPLHGRMQTIKFVNCSLD